MLLRELSQKVCGFHDITNIHTFLQDVQITTPKQSYRIVQHSRTRAIYKRDHYLNGNWEMVAIDEIFDQNVHFSEEIVREILLKLPAKSLFRFKCVSKKWLSLISDPSFLSCYVLRSNDCLPFMFIFQSGNKSETHFFRSDRNTFKNLMTFPFPSHQIESLEVEATSNDLILYRSDNDELFVTNPFTRQCVTLPMHRGAKTNGSTGLISYFINGITSYNIVRPIKGNELYLNLEIFCSLTGEWRNFNSNIEAIGIEFDGRPCIVFNGALHWICNKKTTILAYYLCRSQEKCRFISIPNSVNHMKGMNSVLGVSDKHLRYFEISSIAIHGNKFPGWKLWVLKDYETGVWILDNEGVERKIKSFSVVLSVLSSHSPLIPVAFHPWDKDTVYFRYESYVLTFNCKIGWFEDEFCRLSSASMILPWEVLPLSVSLCPSQLVEPR